MLWDDTAKEAIVVHVEAKIICIIVYKYNI